MTFKGPFALKNTTTPHTRVPCLCSRGSLSGLLSTAGSELSDSPTQAQFKMLPELEPEQGSISSVSPIPPGPRGRAHFSFASCSKRRPRQSWAELPASPGKELSLGEKGHQDSCRTTQVRVYHGLLMSMHTLPLLIHTFDTQDNRDRGAGDHAQVRDDQIHQVRRRHIIDQVEEAQGLVLCPATQLGLALSEHDEVIRIICREEYPVRSWAGTPPLRPVRPPSV